MFSNSPKPLKALWSLAKGERRVSAALYPHPLGVELRIDLDGDMWRTEAHVREDTAESSAKTWGEKFEAKGWSAEVQSK